MLSLGNKPSSGWEGEGENRLQGRKGSGREHCRCWSWDVLGQSGGKSTFWLEGEGGGKHQGEEEQAGKRWEEIPGMTSRSTSDPAKASFAVTIPTCLFR